MVKITYLVHGTTWDNEAEISSGWKDVDLSDLGVEQSIALRDKIDRAQFDVVFCSDLKRATDSAKLTFEDLVPIIPDPRLRECNYGTYNGHPSSIVEPLQEINLSNPFPDGESYDDVKERIREFLRHLVAKYPNQYVAVVGHKAPQLALDVLLRGKTWEEAFTEDWRKTKSWKPGWSYEVPSTI